MSTESAFIITVLMFLSARSIICVISGLVLVDWFFFFTMDYISLLPCMPVNFQLNANHCENYFIGGTTESYYYIYSWALFWNAGISGSDPSS